MDALTQHLEKSGLPGNLMGFGLADDHLRAPDENDNLDSFHGGTKSGSFLCGELAKDA